MTEREYVETLLARAEAYVDWLRQDPSDQGGEDAEEAWHNAKMKMSPFLLQKLCKLWLECDGTNPERVAPATTEMVSCETEPTAATKPIAT
jgi:hypothetical protein